MSSSIRLIDLVPEGLRQDELLVRLLSGFDELLDPIVHTLDHLETLSDPRAAPAAMVDWMCLWLGWNLPSDWPSLDRKRALLESSGLLLMTRGSPSGLADLIRVLGGTDVLDVEIADSGGVTCDMLSSSALKDKKDAPRGSVEVLISGEISAWTEQDREALERVLARELPAGLHLYVSYGPRNR